ncbi:hypothetical protein EN852_001365 [Mesorhizobium sp. M2E.F.Ca.ET.209.01.1.1]|uniref:hypothetical protein n=1 Tax=Mesorhizobium sp. M2E.F.Ca.ET.209.01.1.1 TaxID=2500526 RepID=UPI000FDB0F0D|nr:hypothetical protein [Mesorhizobium sp. M2E.F.Ca.ET.209.01.1.1]TGS19004.1 hypothetical protein EN852_001365 [Mesorhizobium sp. M2E.F.Ca.ET.209.01.1.1]
MPPMIVKGSVFGGTAGFNRAIGVSVLSGPTAIIAFAVAERQASLACAMRPAELEAGRYHMACRKPVENAPESYSRTAIY